MPGPEGAIGVTGPEGAKCISLKYFIFWLRETELKGLDVLLCSRLALYAWLSIHIITWDQYISITRSFDV